ncbi:uncharacterized protein N7482_008322 [Penicillium canariense]|uniref:TauD/TfdA-like domain-containing protein n=1 Tax=Penicillium canariense TaxID=189055 RepID=A0A9W9HVI5_9EURO|nr:uncharacterized protein N7482_008322 [Penicillium canariense]KAJ5157222.1 hypothetical protein N7482_008322 [Penicillium canariense]
MSESTSLVVNLLPKNIRQSSAIGAEIQLAPGMPILNVEELTRKDEDTLRQALLKNQVVIIKQKGIDPTVLPKLAKIFDSNATDIHSAGENAVSNPRNILSAYKTGRIPRAPQVGIVGSGRFQDYEGIKELEVVHLVGFSGWWHMDTPFYERLPGEVTILHSIRMPNMPDQKIKFPDGEEKQIAAGATAFFSGARAFEILTPEEQEFALNTTVTYAPQAYEYIRQCKASEDGLTIPRFGREVPVEKRSDWAWDKVAEHPMVWRNPLNPDRPFLQFHGCCVYKLTTRDPHTGAITVLDNVEEVRKVVYNMQRKIYTARNIYAHRWEEGGLVVFHNRGVMHSITGQLLKHKEDDDKRRLLWQCTMTSTKPPKPFRDYEGVNDSGYARV